MSEKKASFTVTDRRLFTSEGELRKDVPEEQEMPAPKPPAVAPSSEEKKQPASVAAEPPTPSAAQQQEQAQAYEKSSAEIAQQAEMNGISAQEMEMTFERFLASLYMTGMLQLGLMHEQGMPPQVDLIGARQTIDTLGLLSEKTKNNLTSKEQGLLQNALYELRMAYVEVTNAIAKGPQKVPAAK